MSKHSDLLNNYVSSVSTKFSHEETSEMGYRTEFENLIKDIFEEINVRRIDHDAKAKDGNKPDFAVLKNDIPILYIEAKDIGVSLDKVEKSEQMSRYYGYTNLVLTDYLEFRFYRNGLPYGETIKVATYDTKSRTVNSLPEQYDNLVRTLLEFTLSEKEPIRSGKHLSKIMGGKAQRIRDNVKQFLATDSEKNVILNKVYETIKRQLVHDLTKEAFADMYAQTLVYGLFAARYYDSSPNNFTRFEALDLIPASNPFLRHFFDHIVGADFDKRLEYIVNELCEVFSHANVSELMKEYFKTDLWGKTHRGPDPVIHFYEDFLKEYDPDLRKKMGAFYTPLPVVQFIVRSVDYLIKKDFGLPGGLADTSKTTNGLHKVQILDPAVGTGTFISKIIQNIYKNFEKGSGQEGRWHQYVLHDLLPRIYGFELMMTPYTIAHLKLSLAFKETGFKYFNNQRLRIYLTNALEESTNQEGLFSAFGLADSIAEESKEAAKIKNEMPIMVVMGNPPYSVSSSNKGRWIQDLIKVYKENLNERKINLDDDYIKFIRFAEHFIEKNKSGIVAMITNNSFIDGLTHRQMRKHLLETFDEIYILDLHGNAKKKEKSPDGGKDENVFEIQQGVSINILVRKNKEKKEHGTVYHCDVFGEKQDKYRWLDENNLSTIEWKKLECSSPYYFFVPKDFDLEDEYHRGFSIEELMPYYNSGIQTKNDRLTLSIDESDLDRVIEDFQSETVEALRSKYKLVDTSGWNVKSAKDSLLKDFEKVNILYRPFDIRHSIIQKTSGGFIGRPRYETTKQFLHENLGLVTVRQLSTFGFQHVLVTKSMIESGAISLQTKEWGYIFPLYVYADDGSRVPNLSEKIIQNIKQTVKEFSPEDVFDYVYAVLHSSVYRQKYSALLKIDFPRIQYPISDIYFNKMVELGRELRKIHLFESEKIDQNLVTYPVSGNDTVDMYEYKNNKVYINSDQYFGDISELAWNFYIGGYQPAQKWLKDRKGRILTNEDIEHYQKMIVALVETSRLMKEIDGVWSREK